MPSTRSVIKMEIEQITNLTEGRNKCSSIDDPRIIKKWPENEIKCKHCDEVLNPKNGLAHYNEKHRNTTNCYGRLKVKPLSVLKPLSKNKLIMPIGKNHTRAILTVSDSNKVKIEKAKKSQKSLVIMPQNASKSPTVITNCLKK